MHMQPSQLGIRLPSRHSLLTRNLARNPALAEGNRKRRIGRGETQEQVLAVGAGLNQTLPVQPRRALGETTLRRGGVQDLTLQRVTKSPGQAVNGMSFRHESSCVEVGVLQAAEHTFDVVGQVGGIKFSASPASPTDAGNTTSPTSPSNTRNPRHRTG